MTVEASDVSLPLSPGRRGVPGLATPFPLADYTPAMLAEDPVVQQLLDALDEVLAPIISTLDCFDAYLDPYLAPIDFVRYLSSWLLVSQQSGLSEEAHRTALALAVQRSTWRGTKRGIEARLRSLLDVDAVVNDIGSVTTSRDFTPPESWPVAPAPEVTISVPAARHLNVELVMVAEALQSVLPAHVSVTITQDE